MDSRHRARESRNVVTLPSSRASARHGAVSEENFLPYVHAFVERAESKGYDRVELVSRLLEVLDRVSSHPSSGIGGS